MTAREKLSFPTLTIVDQSEWTYRPHCPQPFAVIPWYGGPAISAHMTRSEAEHWLTEQGYAPSFSRRSWILKGKE